MGIIANTYRKLTAGRLRYPTFAVIAYFVIAAVGSLSVLGTMGVAKACGQGGCWGKLGGARSRSPAMSSGFVATKG